MKSVITHNHSRHNHPLNPLSHPTLASAPMSLQWFTISKPMDRQTVPVNNGELTVQHAQSPIKKEVGVEAHR